MNRQQALGLDLGQPAARGVPILAAGGARVLTAYSNAGTATFSASINDTTAVLANDYELAFDGANYSLTRLPDRQAMAGRPFSPAALAAGVSCDGVSLQLAAGTAQTGDRFLLQPAAAAAQGMQLALNDPKGIAAASPYTASVSANNVGSASVASVLAVNTTNTPNLQADITFTSDTGNYTWTLDDGTTVTSGAGTWSAGSPIALGSFELRLDGVPRNGDKAQVLATVTPAGNNGNALAFAKLGEGLIVGNSAAWPGMNITDAYASALADIGVRVQGGKTAAGISASLAQNAEAVRSDTAGVNLDEEAARLIQFQQSYQAAAKILQVAQTIFQTLLQTGAA